MGLVRCEVPFDPIVEALGDFGYYSRLSVEVSHDSPGVESICERSPEIH